MPRGILPEVKLQAVKGYISGNGSYRYYLSLWQKAEAEDSIFSAGYHRTFTFSLYPLIENR